ncbi:MAG: hypothetical protein KBB94_04005 [Legionellaceae bacterium]|nr:hypothetical protein [Legionellaceae bacterium]MBP9774240.1 hypothetical protein [Legionellaceae bacterium]
MRLLTTILFCVLSLDALAQEVYPTGCIPWPIHEAIPTFTNTQPSILMLHNLSNNDLWVTRSANDQGAQAGFNSLLQAGKWSSLAINLDKTSLPIKCIESQPGHEQEISCADVLAICQWPKTKFPEIDSGIFWAGENMHLAPLQAFLARQGYVLQ